MERDSNKHDLVRKIGRTNIGESSLILDNLDCAIFLTPEYIKDNKYMGFKLTKHRYPLIRNRKLKDIDNSFYQPFAMGSEIRFIQDINNNTPAYKTSLVYDQKEVEKCFGATNRFSLNKEVKEISDIDSEYLIDNGTVYESNTENKMPIMPPKEECPLVCRVRFN
jgi:hypothetical protein